jgi:hypothetical protein
VAPAVNAAVAINNWRRVRITDNSCIQVGEGARGM